ncbi:hypothetical protein NQ315_009601 [Exocentrus adspersus]|uniref:Uncharacterized protein n=1 Tax=Exocentrus adspersus TaxID=1586481 RepID=A0AAV8WH52_9CUCU|nr:hypothetical protein NQ315_009601 [Exocentrus adspersus]
MGKSMFLDFIHSKLSPHHWVIYMDLKKFRDSIKGIQTTEQLISFFCECHIENVNKAYHGFLQTIHNTVHHKVVWLIDDYEEINDPKLLKLLKQAKRRGFTIWIVARPFLKSELENTFHTFSMELQEFNENDQMNFIAKYLKQQNKNEDDIKKTLIANMRRVHDIYEKFIEIKVNNEDYGVDKEWYIRTISKLALRVFFQDMALTKVFDLEEFSEDKVMYLFLVTSNAEFLAARWLLHTAEKQISGRTPFNVTTNLRWLYLKELTGIRLFFDNMLTKQLPLHSAIVNKENDRAEKFNNKDYFFQIDLLQRSVFHLVSGYGNYFDIGIPSRKPLILLRNLDVHSHTTREDQNILLYPIESEIPQKPNANINLSRYLSEIPLVESTRQILRKDKLKMNCFDYALLSGSLLELDALLHFRNSIPQPLLQDTKYFLLFHCVKNGYRNILNALGVQDLNNIKIGGSKMSLLHLAVCSENMEAIEKLTSEHNLDYWGIDNEGNTPLHIACNRNNHDILEYLINLKTIDTNFINRKNFKGESHLYILARRRGHEKFIQKIIKTFQGIEIDSECLNGNTPFIVSIIFNKIQVATLLHSNGAEVNHENRNKMTALHYAASKGFSKCMTKLLSWGANINQKDNYGITPLMRASTWGHTKMVSLLLRNKAKLNLVNRHRWAALHYAVKRNNIEIIALLLKWKPSVNIVDSIGDSPILIACKYNFPKAVELLLSCDITYGKKRALRISIEKGHKECIDLLLQAGITL